ncbi:hypothetical protein [Thiocystis violascens]|uniref:RRM domain-containing protein n=1 Tax=Thiocystis violascens (strain ATCC 17096 / DSM 198 / 6111) TaxID=765911 RepID=I3YAZ3_THIV6|nr:hypothetical protein [Thiocystis violascens]AFL74161.1 hypothetical protein Thivi_2211 [Thiocystis violascens DSM 198]
MDIFIGNLPGTATLVELTDFLHGVDLRTHFQCHEGYDEHARNYHFVVARTATPEEGLALIERLNGRLFEGQRVEAREYLPRGPGQIWDAAERRVNRQFGQVGA